jgi:hypothetical protein
MWSHWLIVMPVIPKGFNLKSFGFLGALLRSPWKISVRNHYLKSGTSIWI